MKTVKLSDHFWAHELFSKGYCEKILNAGRDFNWYISKYLIYDLEATRAYFGKPIIINDWYTGGEYQYRGFRTSYENNYNVYNGRIPDFPSQHQRGVAVDFVVKGVPAPGVQEHMKKKYRTGGLGCSDTFTHFDKRDSSQLVLWGY